MVGDLSIGTVNQEIKLASEHHKEEEIKDFLMKKMKEVTGFYDGREGRMAVQTLGACDDIMIPIRVFD